MLDDNDMPELGHLPPTVNQLLQEGVAAHFTDPALAALKCLAFIYLLSGQPGKAEGAIRRVVALDRDDAVGGSVVAALLAETRFAI